MMQINNNRGFTVMLPKTKEEPSTFTHEIKFVLFNKEFKFSLQVKPAQKADD